MTDLSPAAAPDPSADTPDFDGPQALSPRILLLWRLLWGAVAVILTLTAVGIGAAATAWPTWVRVLVPVVVVVVVGAAAVLIPAAQYRRWRYSVTDDGIELSHGVVVQQQSSVPHFRVQHVDLRRGLIQRWLGIVSLTVSTASPATDAELPGLAPDQAESIRRRILDRTEADDGV